MRRYKSVVMLLLENFFSVGDSSKKSGILANSFSNSCLSCRIFLFFFSRASCFSFASLDFSSSKLIFSSASFSCSAFLSSCSCFCFCSSKLSFWISSFWSAKLCFNWSIFWSTISSFLISLVFVSILTISWTCFGFLLTSNSSRSTCSFLFSWNLFELVWSELDTGPDLFKWFWSFLIWLDFAVFCSKFGFFVVKSSGFLQAAATKNNGINKRIIPKSQSLKLILPTFAFIIPPLKFRRWNYSINFLFYKKNSKFFWSTAKLSFSWVSQFDGENSLFSEYEYAEIAVNRCFLPVKP
ncbi:hypothetical protein MHP7448_0441 [Mesomycoplasma hyopneumoniae 7448]|uniref:Uncharacterized protein n=1 Tax=Mesomycoplasma hyopneumoniae (strain 7448) TaxID=262722 RepID=Q4A7T0_MESH7|nr:hypothetical protein MHP7448_0441 [Mesomycoplasma hyopneumoniae 7448]